ncbi:MAG: hypothetical protein IJD80_01740 [Oscillospiraceae bacterium]|nr:hypothetical protein [Oscillospiraceae bacterium]
MFRDDYKKELDNLTLSEEYKQQLIQRLKQADENRITTAPAKNTVLFRKKAFSRFVAASAVIIAATVFYTGISSGLFLATESEDAAMPDISAETENQYDSLTNDENRQNNDIFRPADNITFTINDAVFADTKKSSASAAAEFKQNKIYYNNQSAGGMGYEAYQCYAPQELEQNPVYNVTDELDTLPIYEFTPLSPDKAVECAEIILSSLDIEMPESRFTWSKPVYREGGQHYTNEEIVTHNTVIPGDDYNLSYIDGDIVNKYGDSGEFSLWATRGMMRISFDSNLSDIDETEEIIAGVHSKYPGLIDFENCGTYSWYDYTYFGELNRRIYTYKTSKDYGENIFNATINNTSISQVKQYDEDVKPTKTFFWVNLPYYTKVCDLPAITYQQALGQLFNGNFYSSYTKDIRSDLRIEHIELTYLPPEYKMDIPGYKGYSVPFYKFFIHNPENTFETDNGTLNEYYVCYVCAIHPDYIQLDESYYRFN